MLNQLARWLPTDRLGDADWRRRATLLLAVCAVYVVLGPLFAAMSMFRYHTPSGVAASAGCTLLALAAFPLLKRTGSLPWVSSLAMAAFAITIFAAGLSVEGLASPALARVAALPLFAAAIAGRATALVWAAILGATMVVLAALDRYAMLPAEPLPSALHNEASAWNWLLLTVFVAAIAGVYETLRQRAAVELNDAQRALATAREDRLISERRASLGTLASGLAHEINNPLTIISINAELLADGLAKFARPELRAAAIDVKDAAMRLSKVVQALKPFGVIAVAEPQECTVSKALNLAQRLLPATLKDTAVLNERVTEASAVGMAPSRLSQVLLDLLLNAYQAMPNRDPAMNRIDVTSTRTVSTVELTVTDNGSGMSDEVQRRAFDPFFTTRDIGAGRGLGLFVAHTIVEAAGGTIEVASQPGVGTTVTVTLPLARVRAAA